MVVGSVEVLHNGGPLLPHARLWGTRKIVCTSNKWELEMHRSILYVAARVKDLSHVHVCTVHQQYQSTFYYSN
jgi:hypothetical protein